jgi:hypothetical protein
VARTDLAAASWACDDHVVTRPELALSIKFTVIDADDL